MPRISEAAKGISHLSIVKPKPPPAPSNLSPNEKKVWSEVFASIPSGLIKPSAYALIELYCTHVALARTLSKAIKRCKPGAESSRVDCENDPR